MSSGSWQALADQLRARGERRLVLVEADRDQALACVRQLLQGLMPEHGLWIGQADDRPHPALQALAANRFRQHLGTENPLVVWDGWQGNPPDAVAAMAGTLAAGGLWFWLMPPLARWPEFPDPDYARTGLPASGQHPFMARLASVLADTPTVIRLDTAEADVVPSLNAESPGQSVVFQPTGTDDQAEAIEAIVRTGQGRRRRPLVITADRGRGKSAALGMAAVRLLREGRRHIVVVSPRKENVVALFRHATELAGVNYDGQTELQLDSGGTLRWLPIDDLLARRPEAELVMVDEAAALPAPLLKQVLLGWPRVVFASTVHGYEGSGRGFKLRFRSVLDRETPHWQSLTLKQPVRWSPGDPLEPLVNRLFLLDAEGQVSDPVGSIAIENWSPARATETERTQAFGLLVDAHYRTTPGDFRQWMDDPEAVSVIARQGNDIVGVLWATVEGGLTPELAQNVLRGERRLKGHLLPQSLANHGGDAEAATLRMLRVVRVAVNEQCRRRGVGRHLLEQAIDRAAALNLDAIGTSYGAAPELLPFWQSCGLRTVRLGISREASSGEYAVQMLRGISEEGQACQRRLSSRFAEQWPVLLPVVWPTLAPELVLAITADLPPAPALTEQELVELKAFAYGHRGFELTLPALKRLAVQDGIAATVTGVSSHDLWVASVQQIHAWGTLRDEALCSGRADGERQLRRLTAHLVDAMTGESTG